MGKPLVKQLSTVSNVFVTTRQERTNEKSLGHSIEYIKGNAKDIKFLTATINLNHWDAVVDFMVWDREFGEVLPLLLSNTNQYVFISSARVYSQSDVPITENTPRLLDISNDEEYLKTNEYALAKAREEDMLFRSGSKNFTIVRPSITYNSNRLQLGVLEIENWLYRVLQGRSLVFSKDIADKVTTMTFGDDVAQGITSLIGKNDALGEVFQITSPVPLKWNEVLDVYLNVLEKHLGKRPQVVMTEKTTCLKFSRKKYQVIYCRYFNRTFDNTKVGHFCDVNHFTTPQKGLEKCLEDFLANPNFGTIDWALEGVNDRITGEHARWSELKTLTDKKIYLKNRYNLIFILSILRFIRKILRIS